MPTIVIPSFGGEVPKTTPRLLENNQASLAVNCKLERGELAPLAGPKKMADLPAKSRTIFRHPQDGWLSWDKQVSVVKSSVYDAIGEKSLGQLFITGDRKYPTQYLAGGTVCRLGLPRPEKAPLVEVSGSAASATVECFAYGSEDGVRYPARYGSVTGLAEIVAENVGISAFAEVVSQQEAAEEGIITDCGIERSSSYCFTYVRSLAAGRIKQESAPSPPSEIVDVPDGGGVKLSGFPIPDLEDARITHIRIYRTVSGTETSEFHFLAELKIPVAEYLDTILDKDVSAEVLQTSTWDAIPDDAEGLIATSNGIYAAFRGNELLISEPHIAYAFPADYRLTVEDQIVALGHIDDTIVILTKGVPYLAYGASPGEFQLVRLPIEQACVSAGTVAHLAGGVIYASPDGLMLFSSKDQRMATNETWTREQWQALDPASLLGALLDGEYLAFFKDTSEGFVFTVGAKDFVRVKLPDGMRVRGIYHHTEDDCIYLAVEMNGQCSVWQWEAGEALEYVWRSKPFFTSRMAAMNCLRIEGGQNRKNPALVRIYGPGEKARQQMRIADSRAKRISVTRMEKLWRIELAGKAVIYEVRLGSGVEALEYGA